MASVIALAVTAATLASPDLSTLSRIDARTPADVQIALARTAGPPVSGQASIFVLGPHGYALAHQGSNGFACLVEREHFDTIEPKCYDPEGTRTLMKASFFVEEQRASGKSEEWIASAVEQGYATGRFSAPGKPGIVYMLSPHNHIFDPDSRQVIHIPGHLMFYAPNATSADVGSGPGAPNLTHPGHPDNMIVVVPATGHQH